MKMTAHLAALLELLLAHCSEKIVKARRGILDSWRGVSPVGQPRDKPVADFGSVAAAVYMSSLTRMGFYLPITWRDGGLDTDTGGARGP